MVTEMKGIELPGLDCGLCGYRTCQALADKLPGQPDLLKRCVMLLKQQERDKAEIDAQKQAAAVKRAKEAQTVCGACAPAPLPTFAWEQEPTEWKDSLGRDFDFFLEHLPEDPGPREVCLPHNPMLTRELNMQVGDVMIGRPLGMSCGCPITHCGVVIDVDQRTGVIVWCVTGPLRPRLEGFKDIGYYSAEAYEGIVTRTNAELRIGQRYFFQPRMCMLQWRHSGLINFIQNTPEGTRIRLEGLLIG
ncbi:MAG: Fe-S cluster protein [Myxococcales bacterium]|nr:Fe-S cluster protein [Myxococcales bacterium]